MKRYLSYFAVAFIGALLGALLVRSYFVRAIHVAFPSALQAIAEKQEYTCAISLASLNRLEAGEIDGAKLVLAREVASYYHHPLGQTQGQRQKLLDRIEQVRPKSPTLEKQITDYRK